jgi:crotonobetainyl-CoA:carnitine CoA-transferase CaiB-like acyl-CoA transferase
MHRFSLSIGTIVAPRSAVLLWLRAEESTYFMSVNRNKRSIEVDVKSPEGVSAIKQLVRQVDVVVENFIPGKMDELGLGYDQLKAVNPRIIFASISGFGPTGPRSKEPGYDVAVAAIGGLLSITGVENGPSTKVLFA